MVSNLVFVFLSACFLHTNMGRMLSQDWIENVDDERTIQSTNFKMFFNKKKKKTIDEDFRLLGKQNLSN